MTEKNKKNSEKKGNVGASKRKLSGSSLFVTKEGRKAHGAIGQREHFDRAAKEPKYTKIKGKDKPYDGK